MKRCAAFVLLSAAMLASGCSFWHRAHSYAGAPPAWTSALLDGTATVSDETAQRALDWEVLEKLYDDQFDELESMAQQLHAHPQDMGCGFSAEDEFYQAFSLTERASGEGLDAFIQHLTDWERARPQSRVLPLAVAEHFLVLASGKKAPPWERSVAERALDLAQKRNPANPLVPALRIELARQRQDTAAARAAFQQAVHLDPYFLPAYARMLGFLFLRHLPWSDFLNQAADATRARWGDAAYAMLVVHWEGLIGEAAIKSDRISWQRLRQGFLDFGRLHPGGIEMLNRFCKFACWKGDRRLARALFERLGGDPGVRCWYDVPTFDHWQSWASESGSSPGDTAPPAVLPFEPAPIARVAWHRPVSVDLDRVEFRYQVLELLHRRRYGALEGIANALRRDPPRNGSLRRDLATFYGGFGDLENYYDLGVERLIDRLHQWEAEVPASPTPRIAEACMEASWAWRARGSGTVDTVPASAWKPFEDRLGQARLALDAAAKMTPDPEYYAARLLVEMALSDDVSKMRATFDQGTRLAPEYADLYQNMGNILLPQWHGRPGEVVQLAATCADRTAQNLGQSLYALVALPLAPLAGISTLQQQHFDWNRLRRGFRDACRRKLCSPEDAYTMSLLAQMRGDAPTLASAFQELGDSYVQFRGVGQRAVWQRWIAHPYRPLPGHGKPRVVVEHVGYFKDGLVNQVPQETTTRVSVTDPRPWGILARIDDVPPWPARSFHVRYVKVHPPIRLPDGKISTVDAYERDVPASGTPLLYSAWLFEPDKKYEWVRGSWTSRIYVNGQLVVQRTFTVH